MSGVHTHILVGAVGGLGLARWFNTHPTLLDDLLQLSGSIRVPFWQGDGFSSIVIATSALLATWPDIDEPRSWIGRRARWSISILCGLLLALEGWVWAVRSGTTLIPLVPVALQPSLTAAIAFVLGATLIGPWLGSQLLLALRTACGGHRALTHSLVLNAALLAFGGLCWWVKLYTPALMFLALWWGQLLHLPADLVTPHGLALCAPLSHRRVSLPYALAQWGELGIAIAAGVCGWSLLP